MLLALIGVYLIFLSVFCFLLFGPPLKNGLAGRATAVASRLRPARRLPVPGR